MENRKLYDGMTRQELFEDYCKRLRSETDEELVDRFNGQTQSTGAVGARFIYLSAIHHEFNRRGFDYSAVGDKETLSFNRRVILEGKKLVLVEGAEGKGHGGSVIRI